MKTLAAYILGMLAASAIATELPDELLLWPAGAPGSEGKDAPVKVVTSKNGERQISSIHWPSITIFLPEKGQGTGTAVLVIPGGGHRMLCVDHEGVNLAEWLVKRGIAAFVLKHRLAREEGSTYTIQDHALADTRRAMRLIRSRAAEWEIDPARFGAIGFSAGGELVAQISMKPGDVDPKAADPIDRFDARPDFQAMIYPGRSGDIQPQKGDPPAFLLASANDRPDISEGLTEVYLRFKRAGTPAELILYASGGHGFGLRSGMHPPLSGWPDRFLEWLTARGILAVRN